MYRYLEHTADVKFEVIAQTLEEAFRDALKATTGILIEDVSSVKLCNEVRVKISSRKIESLLYDFIEEMIYLLDTKGFLIGDVKNIKIEENKGSYFLEGIFLGDNYKNYELGTCIKSMTYNDMVVEEIENGWRLQIVLDI